MRVLVAADRCGALTSIETTTLIADGWRQVAPHVEVVQLPQGDGSLGTAQLLAEAAAPGVTLLGTDTAVPVFRDGSRAWLDAPSVADAVESGSDALGHAVRDLLGDGITELVIGLGATGPLDGGRGLVATLAGSADEQGLQNAARRLEGVRVTAVVATDRQLLGFHGACYSAVEEAGITKESAQVAEQRMGEWLDVVRAALPAKRDLLQGKDIRPERQPGAGAAGGLGFILGALGAHLAPGPSYVARATDLAGHVASAQLVVTATGVFDWRVLEHSVPAEVTGIAAHSATPVVVLADEVHVGRREQMSLGLQGAYSIQQSGWNRRGEVDAAELSAGLTSLAARVAGTWTPAPRDDVR
ncbi:glycerate kinase [Yimella sp. cx-51]|uniref:glycerate kinase n=1 Tax=Yimella sp. cx-51 TaxID=2770551 RepID=UPI00165E8BFA|nr:glycerate kinase [Yimella sp. cx-51]MBC9957585.1 glycerate kinase [Yimella sp. cx-51]QTH37052.1 glycerate kinase [Yimella sp. cx-51]